MMRLLDTGTSDMLITEEELSTMTWREFLKPLQWKKRVMDAS